MKEPIALFLLFTFCASFLISCNDQNLEISTHSTFEEISVATSENSEESPSKASSEEEQLPLYTDVMPPLTPEEEAKVNEIVPIFLFNISNEEREEIYSELYEKDSKKMTYGELWRFTNRGKAVVIEISGIDDNGNYIDHGEDYYERSKAYQSNSIYSEYKSVKSVSIQPHSDILPVYFDSVWEMKWLEELTFQDRGSYSEDFGNMPEGFGNLKNLKRFYGDFAMIYSFPDIFDGFNQLEYFSCTYNYLEKLPPSFYRLPNLKELDLDANPLTLSPAIAQMQSLEILTLPSVYEYPDELGELKNLKELYIKSSRYTLQEEREDVATRTEIKLTECPERILLGSVMSARLPLKYAVLPEGIGGLENLEKLECWYVKDPLPESIGNLTNLTWLYLSGEIIYLPESIGNLKNLAWICISSELFISLPESFGDLQSLISINFADDKLEETAWAMIEAKKQ